MDNPRAGGDLPSMTDGVPGRRAVRFRERLHSAWRPISRRLQLSEDGKSMVLSILLAAIVAVGISIAVFLDPKSLSWFPRCPFRMLTGLDCPGCGTARAIHAAANGRWYEAFRSNPILVVAIPFLLAIIIKPQWARKPSVAWSVFVVVVGWTLVRNLFSW